MLLASLYHCHSLILNIECKSLWNSLYPYVLCACFSMHVIWSSSKIIRWEIFALYHAGWCILSSQINLLTSCAHVYWQDHQCTQIKILVQLLCSIHLMALGDYVVIFHHMDFFRTCCRYILHYVLFISAPPMKCVGYNINPLWRKFNFFK